jgi:hypothetical protein
MFITQTSRELTFNIKYLRFGLTSGIIIPYEQPN